MTSYSQYSPAPMFATSGALTTAGYSQPQAVYTTTSSPQYVVQQQQPQQYYSAQPTQSVVYASQQYPAQQQGAVYTTQEQFAYQQPAAQVVYSSQQQPVFSSAPQVSYVSAPATTQYVSAAPQISYVQQPQPVTTQYLAAPATPTTQYIAAPQQYVSAGSANAALALDAADGKIDGKFFGRQIVPAGANTRLSGGGGSAAARSVTPRRLTDLERYEAMKELAQRQRTAQQTMEREIILQQQAARVMTGDNNKKRSSSASTRGKKEKPARNARRSSLTQQQQFEDEGLNYGTNGNGMLAAYPPLGIAPAAQPQQVVQGANGQFYYA